MRRRGQGHLHIAFDDESEWTIYFTGKPMPTVWGDVDEYAYIGFSLDDKRTVTGLMIEHFSRCLLKLEFLASKNPKIAC